MARAQSNKLYRTFVKGLITEASPLTYPEDATTDEDNMFIFQAGNRTRRQGIDFEAGAVTSPYSCPTTQYADIAVATSIWQSANTNPDKNFVVVQFGNMVYFYDQAVYPLSNGLKPYSINLTTFAVNSQDPSTQEAQMAAGMGYLFIVHPVCEPILVIYDDVADQITTQQIYITMRDFKGVDDGLAIGTNPPTLSIQHQYNLYNQGWLDPTVTTGGSTVTYYTIFGDKSTETQTTDTPIQQYYTAEGNYPNNAQQWWVAKDTTTGAFSPSVLLTYYFGSLLAPRGHYVVEAFNIDRSAVSGIAGIPVEATNQRPPCVAFFAGRVWYGLNDTIYYSQILLDKSNVGKCYQDADPTSEIISDLIATDGGVLPIPEMINVCKMVPVSGGIMCFATNGIWFIGGSLGGGFTATDQTVTKVNPVGTDSPNTIVHVQTGNSDMILWWARVGIQAMQQRYGSFGPVDNRFDSSIISLTTIQTFYNDIPQAMRPYARGTYDPATNRVQWLYNDGNAPYNYTYNRILNYDLTLKAFYPWTFSESPNYVAGIFPVITDLGNEFNPYTKYLVVQNIAPNSYLTFGEVSNTNFADWGTEAYNSYMETGYELEQDAMRKKEALYVFCYFRRTESGWLENPLNPGEYTLTTPSSCRFQARWDWADSQVSNEWTSEVEAYRLGRIPVLDPTQGLDFDNGSHIVFTRNKIRGHGKAIQFRFASDAIGADFQILGWAVPYTGNTEP